VADDKAAHDRALEMFVYAPVGVALYVRDMLPMMMGVFVSRGKREVQSHLPGQAPPPPPMPPTPSPADMRRKVEEGIGLARIVAESGVGVAKGVAGSSFGIARDLAGTAVQGLGAMRPDANPSAPSASPPGADAARSSGATARSATPGAPPAPAPTTSAPSAAPGAPSATVTSVPSSNSAATAPAPTAPSVSSPGPVIGSSGPVVGEHTGGSTGDPGAPLPQVDALAIPDYDELSASQVVERLEGLDAASLDAIRRYEGAHRGRNTILGKIAQLT
jgi:hypothetical protein